MCIKLLDEWRTVYTLIRRRILRRLIRVYTVCSGFSVPVLRVIAACPFDSLPLVHCEVSTDCRLFIFFLFFSENRVWRLMQIITLGNNVHKMSNPCSLDL